MKRLLSYFKPLAGYTVFMLILKVIGTLADLLLPWTLGHIIDDVVPECTADDLSPVFLWGLFMLFCAGVAYFGSTWANRGTAKITREVMLNLRQDLFGKILSLSSSQSDGYTVPSLIARMSTDTYFIHNMLRRGLSAGIRSPILLVGGIAVTVIIEPVLALVMVALLPVLGGISWAISARSFKLYKTKQKKNDDMVKVVRDDFAGIRVIKALSKTNFEKEHFEKVNTALSDHEKTAGRTVAATGPVFTMCLNLGKAGIIALGAWRVYTGASQPGQIISFISFLTIIMNAMLTVASLFNDISRGAASISRIDEIFNTETDFALLDIPREETDNFIEFRDVTFAYNKNTSPPTVSHLSFAVKRGQTLGVIGGTGSGKSTVIGLLMRFYDVDSGSVLINGRDVRSIPPEELYSIFGVTFQNDFIFADSVSENIRFSRSVNGNAIERAARLAQAYPFISEFEDGFNHKLLGGGVNVSGGQKQRILVSRALAGENDILILDDSSSALDYKTDQKLREALSELPDSVTTVVIAQRASSIHNADVIVVLENGEMRGIGTHEELMKSCDVYREIAESQMGDFDL